MIILGLVDDRIVHVEVLYRDEVRSHFRAVQITGWVDRAALILFPKRVR